MRETRSAEWPHLARYDAVGSGPVEPGNVATNVERLAEMSARLIGPVRALAVSGVEGSFKLSKGSLLANRLMLGVSRADVADEAILRVLPPLRIPGEYLAEIRRGITEANLVLFGFEDGAGDGSYRFYLEFWEAVAAAVRAGHTAPMRLYLGFKWSASTGAKIAVTDYHCFPLLTPEEVGGRLDRLYRRSPGSSTRAIVDAIVGAAVARSRRLVYVEGEEEGSTRHSFDIRLYEAGLKIREVIGDLAAARDLFAVPADRFDRLIEIIGGKTLGHISAGTGRDGREFLTIYYDAE